MNSILDLVKPLTIWKWEEPSQIVMVIETWDDFNIKTGIRNGLKFVECLNQKDNKIISIPQENFLIGILVG